MSCPEQLSSLEAWWRLKRGSRLLPRRSDFMPETLRPWLGNLAIVAVEREPVLRFRVVLSGDRLDDYRGFAITGRYVDTLAQQGYCTLPRFEACVERREPIRFIHDNSPNSMIYRRMAKLLLPLGEDGMTVDRILVGLYPLPANDADLDAEFRRTA